MPSAAGNYEGEHGKGTVKHSAEQIANRWRVAGGSGSKTRIPYI